MVRDHSRSMFEIADSLLNLVLETFNLNCAELGSKANDTGT